MNNSSTKTAKHIARKVCSSLRSAMLCCPKRVQCNICGWEGRRFLSSKWHKYITCPRCRSDVRHRLFVAALQYIENLSFERLIHNKRILHFAPEESIRSIIRPKSVYYAGADFFQAHVDLKLDIANMPEIKDESLDLVIAFDVLEHIPDYKRALEEIHRILSLKGYGVLSVPQKDELLLTYEDPTIITPEDRTRHFGEGDHLRIFGDDFASIVESKGFAVIAVAESMFSEDIVRRHVLFPPILSIHPLATNYRKIFFCQKNS